MCGRSVADSLKFTLIYSREAILYPVIMKPLKFFVNVTLDLKKILKMVKTLAPIFGLMLMIHFLALIYQILIVSIRIRRIIDLDIAAITFSFDPGRHDNRITQKIHKNHEKTKEKLNFITFNFPTWRKCQLRMRLGNYTMKHTIQ